MTQQPQDARPESGGDGYFPAPPTGPYAGSPGTPMPAYDRVTAVGPRDHQGAVVAFILGVFSVVGFVIVGPVAWILASKALKQIDGADGSVYTNRGLAVAGKVLGIIGTLFLVLTVVGLIAFVVILRSAVGQSGA